MSTEEVLAATLLANWKLWTGRAEKKISALTDAQFAEKIAPARNRVHYLIGHLIAVDDMMFPALGLGVRLYPQLDEPYLKQPDGTLPDAMTPAELRAAWSDVHSKLTTAFEALSPAQWVEKHALVSAEDFAREPLRNRAAMVESRTAHIAMHAGQMLLVR